MLLKYKIGVVESAAPEAGWMAVGGKDGGGFEEMCYHIYKTSQAGALLTLTISTQVNIAATFFFLKGRLT